MFPYRALHWQPWALQALLSGLIVTGTLTMIFAEDHSHKGHSPAPHHVEHVARSEHQHAAPVVTQPHVDTSHSSAGSSSHRFEPVFMPPVIHQQPSVNLNVPTSSPVQSFGSAMGVQRIAMGRNDGSAHRGSSSPKPPKVESGSSTRSGQPRSSSITTPKTPKLDTPKLDTPKYTPSVVDQARVNSPRTGRQGAASQTGVNETLTRTRTSPQQTPDLAKSVDAGNGKIRTPKIERVTGPEADKAIKHEASRGTRTGNDSVAGKLPRLKDGDTLISHRDQIRADLDKQHHDLVKNGKTPEHSKIKLPTEIKNAGHDRLERLPKEALKAPVAKNGKIDPGVASRLKLHPAHDVLATRLKNGDFKHLASLKGGQQFQLHKQFELREKGDLARRLNLQAALAHRGGWRHRHFGLISPIYTRHCRSMWYAGPGFCAPYVWYPVWSPWIDWCWWDSCGTFYDPRPIYCRPIIYHSCGPWVAWNFPTWQPLPYATCGTWVDVPPVIVNSGIDVQLLATRFVDPGHPDQQLGPRFRVWMRNNSAIDLTQQFNVMLVASNDGTVDSGLPQAGIRISGLHAGETQAVDIRLPFAANTMGRDTAGHQIPFTYLTALVDSHNELSEADKSNNGTTLPRGDILPVDPSAFAAEPGSAQPNGIIHIAGEGLGPEPGKVMVVIGEQEYQAEIIGWFDLGVQIRLPDFDLNTNTAADVVIIRGDGAAANPLTIEIDPAAGIAPTPEGWQPDLPEPPPVPVPNM